MSHRPPDREGSVAAPATSLVAVAPPAPCRLEPAPTAGLSGTPLSTAATVIGIGADRVLVRLPAPMSDRAATIHLETPGGRPVSLAVDTDADYTPERPDAGLRMLLVTTAGGRAELQDLLTLYRKDQHLTICSTRDVEATDRRTGFEELVLRPRALPELSLTELDTGVSWLGRRFRLPLLITGMTGGIERGAEINLRLGRAAAAAGIPMGVGSQRVALENPRHADIFRLKHAVPDLFLIGNLGAAQLLDPDPLGICARAVEMINADALAIHVNVVQELVQVEGDRDFRGLIERIGLVAARLGVPLIVKEVGAGLDAATARALWDAGVRVFDCGGSGGTSWSRIEGLRARESGTQQLAATFRDWGIPTAAALALLRAELPGAEVVATGGIRDGLQIAKAVALGARACGVGLPLMRAALTGEAAVLEAIGTLRRGLEVAMLAAGARTLAGLRPRLGMTESFHQLLALWRDEPVTGAPRPDRGQAGESGWWI